MTIKEAIMLLNPKTTASALAEIEYYNGFKGKEACIEAIEDACRLAIEALEKQATIQATSKWIPCSERLPETEDKVMCCTETKKGNKNIVIGYYMDGAWRCGMNSNVIAWMPLPEPYKGESK